MTPDAYAWPTVRLDPHLAAAVEIENLRHQIADLEHQANTLAAALIYALTDQPKREPNSQGDQ